MFNVVSANMLNASTFYFQDELTEAGGTKWNVTKNALGEEVDIYKPGGFSASFVGIGTSFPQTKIQIEGTTSLNSLSVYDYMQFDEDLQVLDQFEGVVENAYIRQLVWVYNQTTHQKQHKM